MGWALKEKNRMKERMFALVALILTLALVLAGCGGDSKAAIVWRPFA